MTRLHSSGVVASFPMRVFYEDTDATGVVYHANYLRYLERGRSLWLEALGFTHTRLANELDLGFVVADATLQFRKPARLDDHISVTVAIDRVRRASLIVDQGVWRDDTQLVKAQFTVACVRLSHFAPCALPLELRNLGAADAKIKPKEHE